MDVKNRPALHDLLVDLKKMVNKHADDIEAKLSRAFVRETAGTTKRDGWPASTTGSDGGGGKNRSSATEIAVFGKSDEDRHRELVFAAVSDISDIFKAYADLVNRLESIDDLTKTTVETKLCEVCAGKRSPGHSVDHRGTVGDRLTHVMDLCNDCYQFIVQSADAGSRQGRLPTDKQISDHELRGRWKVRV